MKKILNIRSFLFGLLLMLLSCTALQAQQQDSVQIPKYQNTTRELEDFSLNIGFELMQNAIILQNVHQSIDVNVRISFENKEWENITPITIKATSKEIFKMDGQKNAYILMTTPIDKSILYKLDAGKLYQIYWNVKAKLWDLQEIRLSNQKTP